MPVGWYGLLCDVCFEALSEGDCFVDAHGDMWPLCSIECALKTFGYKQLHYLLGKVPETD